MVNILNIDTKGRYYIVSAIMERYEKIAVMKERIERIGIMIEKGFSKEVILDLGYTEDEYYKSRAQKVDDFND